MKQESSLVLFFVITSHFVGVFFFPSALTLAGQRPDYQKLRYEEDFSFLSQGSGTDFFDPVKFIPLSSDSSHYLSLGGAFREHYEFTQNPAWGDDPQDQHGALLQRYIVHADWHGGDILRFFVQLMSAVENGRKEGPSPVDEDQLTVSNGFVDLRLPLMQTGWLTLRGGRQELLFGSGRLVDVREGPNVRRKFDGGRLIFSVGQWHVDGIAVRPAEDNLGVLDDGTNWNRSLWGCYGTGPLGIMPNSIDLYYLGYRDKEADYEQGTGVETRHSLGTRLWGQRGGWDHNWELVGQWGSFGRGDIRAWTVASDTGYNWLDTPLRPRLGASINIASGDQNPDNPNLQSFNAIFPRGNYFSELALLGPRNFFNVHPHLSLNLLHDVTLTGDVNFFWRQSLKDGVYGPSGQLLRASGGSTERFVGKTLSLNGEWQVNRHLAVTLIYSHFFPGAFIEDTGRSRDIDYYELTLSFIF